MTGKRYLEGEDGSQSSMRLVWAFVMIVSITIWAIISLSNMKLESMDSGFVFLMVAMSGTKVAQNMVEKGNFSLKIGEKKTPANEDPKDPKKPKIPNEECEEPIKPPKV